MQALRAKFKGWDSKRFADNPMLNTIGLIREKKCGKAKVQERSFPTVAVGQASEFEFMNTACGPR